MSGYSKFEVIVPHPDGDETRVPYQGEDAIYKEGGHEPNARSSDRVMLVVTAADLRNIGSLKAEVASSLRTAFPQGVNETCIPMKVQPNQETVLFTVDGLVERLMGSVPFRGEDIPEDRSPYTLPHALTIEEFLSLPQQAREAITPLFGQNPTVMIPHTHGANGERDGRVKARYSYPESHDRGVAVMLTGPDKKTLVVVEGRISAIAHYTEDTPGECNRYFSIQLDQELYWYNPEDLALSIELALPQVLEQIRAYNDEHPDDTIPLARFTAADLLPAINTLLVIPQRRAMDNQLYSAEAIAARRFLLYVINETAEQQPLATIAWLARISGIPTAQQDDFAHLDTRDDVSELRDSQSFTWNTLLTIFNEVDVRTRKLIALNVIQIAQNYAPTVFQRLKLAEASRQAAQEALSAELGADWQLAEQAHQARLARIDQETNERMATLMLTAEIEEVLIGQRGKTERAQLTAHAMRELTQSEIDQAAAEAYTLALNEVREQLPEIVANTAERYYQFLEQAARYLIAFSTAQGAAQLLTTIQKMQEQMKQDPGSLPMLAAWDDQQVKLLQASHDHATQQGEDGLWFPDQLMLPSEKRPAEISDRIVTINN